MTALEYAEGLLSPVTEEHEAEARIIISELTALPIGRINIEAPPLSPALRERIEGIVKRRARGEPLQYILGKWEFMGLPFYTRPCALIPRQDTETLCEEALSIGGKTLLDLCCGTGCIGVSLAKLGGFEVTFGDISPDCLALARENAALNAELAELRNRLDGLLPSTARDSVLSPADSAALTDTAGRRKYEYYPAKVVNNSITRQENYITIDRGADDGMRPDMALVAEGGIAGYIVGCSDRFSVCLSVLNRNFRTSGKIKGDDYFGSVYWDGTSYRHLTLSEIPKYAQIHAGDTIVTTAHSSIFPPDLTIGTVESFELNNATYYDVKVRLHTDIAALNNVLAVRYIDADERGALEQSVVAPEAE